MKNFFKNKKILVAGGTGVIGIQLVKILNNLKCKKIIVVSTHKKLFAKNVLPKKIIFHRADLKNFKNCLKYTKNMDIVFNLVGIKGSVTQKESRVSEFFYSMIMFQTNLMHASKINKIKRYIFVSSICGYPRISKPKKENDFWKGLPKQNDMIPGIVKRIGEIQGLAYLKQDSWKAVRIVRPSNVYGPYDDFNPKTAQVIPALISKIINCSEKKIDIFGSRTIRDFIFSHDVAKIILLVASKDNLVCDPINIGSGRGISIMQLANTIKKISEKEDVTFNWKSSSSVVDNKRVLSISKLKKNFKKIYLTKLSDGLKQTISWYKKNEIKKKVSK